jgi:hypothetical protein
VEEAEAIRRLSDTALPLEVRIAAAAALGRPEVSDAAVDALSRLARREAEALDLRVAAVRAIGDIGRRPRAVELFGRSGEPASYRREVIATLEKLGRVHESREPGLEKDLTAVAADLENFQLRNLGQHYGRDPRVLELCHRAVRDPRPSVRMSALGSLAMIGELAPVIEATGDESIEVREYATGLLGNLGMGDDPQQAEALKRRLTDSEESVRKKATRSLKLLGLVEQPRPPENALVEVPAVDPRFDWRSVLLKFSHAFVRDQWYTLELPDEVVESGWLGFPGAAEASIAATERRLGLKLPPSYRSFLKTTNGFRHAGVKDLFPVEKVVYVEELLGQMPEEELEIPDEQYFVYGPEQDPVTMRYNYLPRSVAVSAYSDDGDMYLLNPAVTFGDEWEAWLLSSRLPGANRYKSFWDLMEEESRTQTAPP